MRARAWRSVLLLPFNVLVVVPGVLLVTLRGGPFGARAPGLAEATTGLAIACALLGTTLMVSTIGRFDREGHGTLAPWDPTQKLVVSGPYRYVRNPMISGVLFNLLAESLLFRSAGLALWFGGFFLANALYLPLFEEPGLERRFGDAYRRYRRAVPRWIPRLRPFDPTQP
jgi:protein-S-isoprenylcysteine O-methyltransferase Ste14